jgi:RHS repeat-associated protein
VVHTDTGEVTQFFIKNHLGSTVRVVNADGSYATTPVFDYQPYGELQSMREDSLNPVTQKYTGKELDSEVNLYYFGARWYDQELGMWISPDPAGQFANPYSYVGGSPLMFYDPYGLWSLGVGIVVGWDRKRGWHAGFGVAADFREEIDVGGNVSHVWNENGSQTSTVGGGVMLDVGYVGVNVGAGYQYNTQDGHTVSGVLGGNLFGLGAEAGTSQYWTTGGDYLGGTAYGMGYLGTVSTRAGAGYQHGWGAYSGASGAFVEARVMGATFSNRGHRFGLDGASAMVGGAQYNSSDRSVSGYTYADVAQAQWRDFKEASIAPFTAAGLVAGIAMGGSVTVSEDGFDITGSISPRSAAWGYARIYGKGQDPNSVNYTYDGNRYGTVGGHERYHTNQQWRQHGGAFFFKWLAAGGSSVNNPYEVAADYCHY